MNSCVILGGGGYIGFNWARRLAANHAFERVILADIRPPRQILPARVEFISCDVRQPLHRQLPELFPDWIFNFAAVHREPGHGAAEYFDTNIPGARHACQYAEETSCERLLFTSSIAVYGPTKGPTAEASPKYPATPYGISKLCAELIHEGWRKAGDGRRLRICRPGVIYGPGDPGNILRLIRAVKRGYFVFPGGRKVRKSYGYIEGLLDSFEWAMAQSEKEVVFNYVERDTEPLGQLVELIQTHLHKRIPTISAPIGPLVLAARLVQLVTAGRSPVHPLRVRKAALATHIVPAVLAEAGFVFRYDFAASLKHWATQAPQDFA